jgi:hypothetical protein
MLTRLIYGGYMGIYLYFMGGKKKQLLSGTPKLIRFWDHDAQPREFRDPLRLGMG